jgi:hypothetical protein
MSNPTSSLSSRRSFNVAIFDVDYSPAHVWNAEKLLELVAVLVVVGQTMSVAIDKNNVVIDGNDLAHCMKILRLKTLRVIYADGLSVNQARRLRRRTNTLYRASHPVLFDQMTLAQLD